ncbi:membrane cofactor protein isoform X3 [Phacochoerus africanus]|uniref:membrane cofactor protein isoform X3 n=1 Tax=Phacochoerus africanus TaxID=41426 RepID=UPI001FDA1D4F|nr:membrane cofactor protein isoform X3 [Phacochoerus africanus]
MMAFCALRKALPCRPENPFSSRCFVEILSVALVFLLPMSSDACDEPPKFESMRPKVLSNTSYRPGDSVEYECRPGFQPMVPALPTFSVCQDDNTWSPLQEACRRKSCSSLPDPSNGQVSYPNGDTLFGSKAQFTCNSGFYIIGAETVYCQVSGNGMAWSDPPPICEKILCKPPGDIPNGKYTNSHKDVFEYNEVVTYSCLSSTGPDEFSLIGESSLFCIGKDKWSSDPPECKVVKCPYPVVPNGEIVSGFGSKFYYKAEVIFKCNAGFTLHGRDTVVCSANSMWEPEMPQCIKESTPPITQPPTPSVSESTPPITQPPTPSVSDSKPTGTPATPGPSHPGGGIIAAIVVGLFGIAVVAAVGICLYRHKCKKRKTEISASYSTYQDKAATPAE